jgi:hypothetical protein
VLAFASHFQNYRQWESFLTGEDPIDGSPHVAGRHTVYLNKRPPHGSTSFPVLTIMVKEIKTDDPAKTEIVARAKRAGTYNSAGAVGWEWFELAPVGENGVSIVWRNVSPPVGSDSYLGDLKGGCNACHHGDDTQSILSAPLQLSQF